MSTNTCYLCLKSIHLPREVGEDNSGVMCEDLIPIVQRSFDFCLKLYGYVNGFPKAQKLLLGRELIAQALSMLVLFVTANRRANKLPELEEASVKVDTLRILLRLSKRLSFLSNTGYEVLSQDVTEIGKMLGGWTKHSAQTWSELVEPPVRGYPFEDGSSQLEKVSPQHKAKNPAVRYTMKSPKVEAYLRGKLEHPEKVVLIRTGAFYKAFFEDAMFLRGSLQLQVKDLSAESEEVAIRACGFPVTALEKYRVKLGKLGKEVYVID